MQKEFVAEKNQTTLQFNDFLCKVIKIEFNFKCFKIWVYFSINIPVYVKYLGDNTAKKSHYWLEIVKTG